MSIGECIKKGWKVLTSNLGTVALTWCAKLVVNFLLSLPFGLIIVCTGFSILAPSFSAIERLAESQMEPSPADILSIVVPMIGKIWLLILVIVVASCIINSILIMIENRVYRKVVNNEDVNLGYDLMSPIKEKYLWKGIAVALIRILLTFLLGLLLIVPGIIYYYHSFYAMWLVTENPDMTSGEILRLSGKMTKGHKGYIFLIDLCSFGIILLGEIVSIFVPIIGLMVCFALSIIVAFWFSMVYAVDYVERRKLVEGNQSETVENDTYTALDE